MVRCAGVLGGVRSKGQKPVRWIPTGSARAKKSTPEKKNQQMAGVKGRSGGPRRNSGGRRAGAGRPLGSRNKPKLIFGLPDTQDPIKWLLAAMNHDGFTLRQRIKIAGTLLPYVHKTVSK